MKIYDALNTISIFLLCVLTLCACKADSNEEIKALKKKATVAEEQLKIAVENKNDVSKVIPKMQQVKVLADNGKIKLADKLLNEILLDFQKLNATPSGSTFVNPRKVNIIGNQYSAMEPFISRDGNILFFNSDKADDPKTEKNIYYAVRKDDTKFQFMGEVKGVNSDQVDGVPTMDIHVNFYYVSTAHYGKQNGFTTVYRGKFVNGDVINIKPIQELSLRKPGWLNMDIEISADGKTIYSTQTLFSGINPGPKESYFFTAELKNGKFIVNKNSDILFKKINTEDLEYAASISTDQLKLFFTRLNYDSGHTFTSYYASRPDIHSPFSKPVKIDAITGFSEAPAITNDGGLLYFHKNDGGRFYIYVLERSN